MSLDSLNTQYTDINIKHMHINIIEIVVFCFHVIFLIMTHDDLSSHSSHLLPTNRYSVQSNLIIETEDSIPELQLFRKAGGQTVVDVSSIGIRRKIEDVPKIARESGVNIITGTGYYVDFTVPEEAKMMTVQEVYIQL